MEDDLDESVFDYISEFDFEGLLPLFWIKCGKDKETLRQKLINDYQMNHEGLLDEAVSEVIENYEVPFSIRSFWVGTQMNGRWMVRIIPLTVQSVSLMRRR